MKTMQQVGMATREFTQDFKNCAQDVGMVEEDLKVHLALVLNQDTLSHLDTYATMHGSDKIAHLETVQDRLNHIPYVQILAYL